MPQRRAISFRALSLAIVASVLIVGCKSDPSAVTDAIEAPLDPARAKWAEELSAADKTLDRAFDRKINAFVFKGDQQAASKLIFQRNQFEISRTLPTAEAMEEAVGAYHDARNLADLEFKAVFFDTIAKLREAGFDERAAQVRAIMLEILPDS